MKTLFTLLTLVALASAACAQDNPEKIYPAKYNAGQAELSDNSFEAVRAFVQTTLAKPLSTDFAVPNYIKEAPDFNEASKMVGARYPEFFGREGDALLTAISTNPDRFASLISETKAIRAQFADSSK